MHAFTIIFASLLAVFQLIMANPPACLLGALLKQPNPADLSIVCAGENMNNNLTQVCSGSYLDDAYNVYSASCSVAGITVAALATSSSSVSGTATATVTGSGPASSSESSSGSTGSGSGGSTFTATGSSSSPTSSKQGAAAGVAPRPLLFATSALLATALGSFFSL